MLAALAAVASAVLIAPPANAATPAASAAATRYEGEGDDLVRIRATAKPGIVKITHDGEGYFSVWALNPAGKENDLLANHVGAWAGTSAFNTSSSHKTAAFSIKADGAWTLEVLPLAKARAWSITTRGTGNDVIRLSSTSRGLHRLKIRHSGEGYFSIWALDANGRVRDLVANRAGAYSGSVSLPPGTRYAAITADGAWSIVRN
ncbi:hypothetical protein [Streptosporangium roseum]|uniref:hypothetical protein n=1 Tax=Streptosporangium roseum TaxID=2001 RepID=UPI003320C2F1